MPDLALQTIATLLRERNALDPYLAVASRVGRSTANGRTAARGAAPAPSRANRDQNQAIRE